MTATIGIYQAYGGTDGNPASESPDLSSDSTRLQTKDQYNKTDTSYPIPIPAVGQYNYSYWIHVYLKITGGTYYNVFNVRFYSSGTLGWGNDVTLLRGNRDSGDKGCPINTGDVQYDLATGTDGTTGHAIADLSNGHDYYNGQTTKTADVMSDTAGSPATIDTTGLYEVTGKLKAVVLQTKVGNNASQGVKDDTILTFMYNEI